jgi:hypothetical protein
MILNRDLMASGAPRASTGLSRGQSASAGSCIVLQPFTAAVRCSRWLFLAVILLASLTKSEGFARRWPACWLFFFGIISGNSKACRLAL